MYVPPDGSPITVLRLTSMLFRLLPIVGRLPADPGAYGNHEKRELMMESALASPLLPYCNPEAKLVEQSGKAFDEGCPHHVRNTGAY
jgi:hypothetical protein